VEPKPFVRSQRSWRANVHRLAIGVTGAEGEVMALHPGMLHFLSQAPPDQLLDNLYLGDMPNAFNLDVLRSLGITHVANVADDVECFHAGHLKYFHMNIEDGGYDSSIVDAFTIAASFVEAAAKEGGKVLIHCAMGVNRSATIAMAVLMQLQGWSLREAYEHVKARRPCIGPAKGNLEKIAAWELETRSTCSMPQWLPEVQGLTEPKQAEDQSSHLAD